MYMLQTHLSSIIDMRQMQLINFHRQLNTIVKCHFNEWAHAIDAATVVDKYLPSSIIILLHHRIDILGVLRRIKIWGYQLFTSNWQERIKVKLEFHGVKLFDLSTTRYSFFFVFFIRVPQFKNARGAFVWRKKSSLNLIHAYNMN